MSDFILTITLEEARAGGFHVITSNGCAKMRAWRTEDFSDVMLGSTVYVFLIPDEARYGIHGTKVRTFVDSIPLAREKLFGHDESDGQGA